MAIGIDKYAYRTLRDRLGQLIEVDKDSEKWLERERELAAAYKRIGELIEEVEQSALHYKKLNAEIRSEVSEGLRKLKKSAK